MSHPRKTFGPLFYGTLILGVCVLLFVGMLRLIEWRTREPNLAEKVAELVPGVTTGDQESRVEVIQSLGKALEGLGPFGDEREAYGRALAALREALRDPDASVRLISADTLGGLGSWARPAAVGLTAALKDDDPDVRIAAARALVRIGGDGQDPALRMLAEMAADPEPILNRRTLIEAMQLAGVPGQEAAAQALVSLLTNEVDEVRADALGCISILGPGAVRLLPALEPMLKATDPTLRYTAALAAMQAFDADTNPDPRVVAILSEAVSDPSLSLTERQNALTGLNVFVPEGPGAMGMVAVAFPAGLSRPSTLRRCALVLARQLEHKDADVRLAAATLLHMISPENLAGEEANGITKP